MDTRLLEYFVTVAAEGSVLAAADELYAAQSTVSAGLRSLERDLGVQLFDRSERRMRLTPAGEELLERARGVLDETERLRFASGEVAEGARARLRVGTFAALDALSGLPQALADFRVAFPLVEVRMTASGQGTTGLAEDLHRGRLDVAFVALLPGLGLEAIELASYRYIALVPPGHPLAERRTVSLAELAPETWVDMLPGYGNRVQVDREFADRGLERRIGIEISVLTSVPPYVAAGLGVAVVPDVGDTAGCVAIELSDEIPPWVVSIATRTGGLRRPPVAHLVEMIRSRVGSGIRRDIERGSGLGSGGDSGRDSGREFGPDSGPDSRRDIECDSGRGS